MQFLANTWLAAMVTPPPPTDTPDPLILLRLTQGHAHRVGNRPNRVEPRAIKRRPKPYPLLNRPRRQFRDIPHRSRYWKNKPRNYRGLN